MFEAVAPGSPLWKDCTLSADLAVSAMRMEDERDGGEGKGDGEGEDEGNRQSCEDDEGRIERSVVGDI
jgi:hypothetical protein